MEKSEVSVPFTEELGCSVSPLKVKTNNTCNNAKSRNPLKRFQHRLSVGRLDELLRKSLSGKKRKRAGEGDSVSLYSLDMNDDMKPKKMRPSLTRKASNASNISLNSIKPMEKIAEKMSRSFQRSFSFRDLVSLRSSDKPFKRPTNSTGKSTPSKNRRLSTYWYETVDRDDIQELDKTELDRQEAIYELYKGELDLISDLAMVRKTYQESMKQLGLLSDDDLVQIFGHIDHLIPLHQSLVDAMGACKLPNGTTESIGQAVLQWIPKLEGYTSYCANQVYAKALLDVKKRQPAIDDFLQRCQDSPFSRKLDLWSFLDVPRSKLVKYPLLFRSIQKVTPIEHDDHFYMEKAIQEVNCIIERVDQETGRAKCQFTREKLEYVEDSHRSLLIEDSTSVICDGVLRTNKGTKLQVFLFDKVLVLTRPISKGSDLRYQVYRTPIPVADLASEDSDNEGSNNSFRNAGSNVPQNGKRCFQVIFHHATNELTYILNANDEHDRRQWMQSIRSTIQTQS